MPNEDQGQQTTGAESGQQQPASQPQGSALANAGAPPLPIHEQIPEKYRVFEGDGDQKTFNLEASASKMAEGYGSLAKKLGSDESAPASPDDYQFNAEDFGEDFNLEEFMKDEGTKGFLKRMHAKGMTNSQVKEVLEYGLKDLIPNLQQGGKELDAELCIKDLKENVWQDETEYTANMQAANRAFRSLPADLQEIANTQLGNNPAFNRIMALIGKEMQEDTTPSDQVSASEQASVEEMMMSKAYKDPKDPQHEIVSAKVRNYFERTTKKAS